MLYSHTFSADGQSPWFPKPRGSEFTFKVKGTIGGGTAKLQYSDDGGTTADDVTDASRTDEGQKVVTMHGQPYNGNNGTLLRFDLSSSTTPTLTVEIWE